MKKELPIFPKYFELVYYSFEMVKKYPKYEHFALAQSIRNALLQGHEHMSYAEHAYKEEEKRDYLGKLDCSLNNLKFYVRLSERYKYISKHNYEVWSEHITVVCNMLGRLD
jgi:hypothetical protein